MRVLVKFTRVADELPSREQQGKSYCASGYVFCGVMELRGADESLVASLPVQTGGWMCCDSPFMRAGRCPACPEWGEYDPRQYPDTAFPALSEPTTLGTLRTGSYRGFRIPDPPGTGRSFLMIHASTRFGSEGCISCPDGDAWEHFCEQMASLQNQGVADVPLIVAYECQSPDPLRYPAASV